MSTGKRKISIRKVIQTLVTIVVVTGFTMAILSADRLQNRRTLTEVDIKIRNSDVVHFLDEQEVTKMLFTDRHLAPEQLPLAKLDIHKMENIARSNPWVSNAEIYVDNERGLHINITQRVPVIRVFEESGHSYYLDADLNAMPLSDRYVHYTPMITGAPQLRDDSSSRGVKLSMLSLVSHIAGNKFWNAQIAQIVINKDNTFELIPILGKQRILLGDTSRVPEKLNNLLAFYQQVENKVGWEKYEVIDLRFRDQVVASPALSWKIPVDRALLNMNWVKAIMESVPKDVKDESVTNALDTGIAVARMATDNIPAPAASARPEPVPVTAPQTPVVAPAKQSTAVAAEKPKPATIAKPAGATANAKPKPATPAVKKPAHDAGIKPAAPAPKRKLTLDKDDKKATVKPKPKPPATAADKKPAKPSKPAAAAHH